MKMDGKFRHSEVEDEIYKKWEMSGAFAPPPPQKGEKSPFTIVLPPPNASGKMHMGNVLMIAIEDLLIRYHRMKGHPTLWVPGTDHAGFETQVTYERELKKNGKSRFQFDRQDLYQQIHDFVHANKKEIEGQIRKMGASVDWSRYTFTLDQRVIETVYKTFAKMNKDGLIYRDNYMVNYCPQCGTTFADLEIEHIERVDPLYYIKYGPLELATVRPETKFGDTALAVHPSDKRYAKYIGQEIEVDGLVGTVKLTVIADEFVNPKFGTGVVKVTPAHDKNDYEAGLRHKLPVVTVIGMNGRLTEVAGPYAGLKVKEARAKVVEDMQAKGLIVKVERDYKHSVALCYKGGHEIEPMILPNWFVKVESLKSPALEVVKSGKVKIFPKWREKTYINWMREMRDWPISRQVVWGIRIPVWYEISHNQKTQGVSESAKSVNQKIQVTFLNKTSQVIAGEIGELLKEYSLAEIKTGLQTLIAPEGASYVVSATAPGEYYLQETDTFDTWFSSAHWPLVTLGYPDSPDFVRFYPTSVLETGWEIIRFWVSRMIMFGIYLTGEPPFESVYLHGLVKAPDGRKMSKSLGNVVNPEEYMDKYGVDALRMGLISGTANGHDFAFPQDKIIGYRNFANKLWNMARFYTIFAEQEKVDIPFYSEQLKLDKSDKLIIKKLDQTIKNTEKLIEKFRFAEAAQTIYHFVWDEVANTYLEQIKEREDKVVALSVLRHILLNSLKILHPFMPYVTEAIWAEMSKPDDSLLINTTWPSQS